MIYADCKACLGRGRVEGMLDMMGNGRMIPCGDCVRREGYEAGARDARASILKDIRTATFCGTAWEIIRVIIRRVERKEDGGP